MNKIKYAFSDVKADEKLKEDTMDFINAKITPKRLLARKKVRALTLAFAVIACIICGTFSAVAAPVSHISIESDSVIELSVNRFNKVVKATAYDEYSKTVLDNLSLMWCNYSDATKQIADYSDSVGDTVIIVSSSNESTCQKIESDLSDHIESAKCHTADTDTVQQAEKNDIPVGKYQAYLELKKYDNSFTLEMAKSMTTKEIRQKIKSYTSTSEKTDSQDACEQSSTACSQNGKKHNGHSS